MPAIPIGHSLRAFCAVALLTAPSPAPPDVALVVTVHADRGVLDVSGTVQLTVAPAEHLEFILSRRASALEAEGRDGAPLALTAVDTTFGSIRYRIVAPAGTRAGERIPVRIRYRASGTATVFDVAAGGVIAGYNTAWYPQQYSTRAASAKVTATLTVDAPEDFRTVGFGVRVAESMEDGRRRTSFSTVRPTALSFTSAPYTMARHAGARPLAAWLVAPLPGADALLVRVAEIADALTEIFGG